MWSKYKFNWICGCWSTTIWFSNLYSKWRSQKIMGWEFKNNNFRKLRSSNIHKNWYITSFLQDLCSIRIIFDIFFVSGLRNYIFLLFFKLHLSPTFKSHPPKYTYSKILEWLKFQVNWNRNWNSFVELVHLLTELWSTNRKQYLPESENFANQ